MQDLKIKDWLQNIESCKNSDELEKIRIELLGKKGVLTAKFVLMKSLADDAKKELAKVLNEAKEALTEKLNEKKSELEAKEEIKAYESEKIDLSLIDYKRRDGAFHPVMQMMDNIIDYFVSLSFSIESGPLVEDDFNNFEALNLPPHHPARDMQDTFYFHDGMLLRTHTSPVQIRTMLAQKPPIRMIAPGAVFRRDYDLTHTPMFHQVEGLVVEEGDGVSFANLKYVIQGFLHHIFGDVNIRFRPSYFPFTEPSSEVDISCIFCKGSGCRVCKNTGWLEVLGCGVVDPRVFEAVGYKDVSGYAFGLGVERFAMLLYQMPDLRSFFEGDIRILEQLR